MPTPRGTGALYESVRFEWWLVATAQHVKSRANLPATN